MTKIIGIVILLSVCLSGFAYADEQNELNLMLRYHQEIIKRATSEIAFSELQVQLIQQRLDALAKAAAKKEEIPMAPGEAAVP